MTTFYVQRGLEQEWVLYLITAYALPLFGNDSSTISDRPTVSSLQHNTNIVKRHSRTLPRQNRFLSLP